MLRNANCIFSPSGTWCTSKIFSARAIQDTGSTPSNTGSSTSKSWKASSMTAKTRTKWKKRRCVVVGAQIWMPIENRARTVGCETETEEGAKQKSKPHKHGALRVTQERCANQRSRSTCMGRNQSKKKGKINPRWAQKRADKSRCKPKKKSHRKTCK